MLNPEAHDTAATGLRRGGHPGQAPPAGPGGPDGRTPSGDDGTYGTPGARGTRAVGGTRADRDVPDARELSPDRVRERIADTLLAARERTRLLTDCVDDHDLTAQHSPLMSPLVWDLAHIGNQEELWLLRNVGGRDPMHPGMDPLYDAFEHPRAARTGLPLLPPAEARAYAGEVRGRVLDLVARAPLEGAPLLDRGFAFGMIAQHEQQHDETMLITHQLRRGPSVLSAPPPPPTRAPGAAIPREALVPAGPFRMGTSAEPWALDNERPAHTVHVDAFFVDTVPVTNAEYIAFIEDGGYDEPRWWTAQGWEHRMRAGLRAPLFWSRDGVLSREDDGASRPFANRSTASRPAPSPASTSPPALSPPPAPAGRPSPGAPGPRPAAPRRTSSGGGTWLRRRFGVTEPVPPQEPVLHVSWYEADAYARWAGRRLPTEAEWEKAARHDPATGESRRYPWGNEEPGPRHANLAQRHLQPAPAGSYPDGASAYGVRQLIGDVWEWTASGFLPYPGFTAFPYREYSEVFFGGDYKVLRGGSFAVDPVACRATFRNWDHPVRRQIFSGFRTVRDAAPEEV